VDTALRFGVEATDIESEVAPLDAAALWAPRDAGADQFLTLVNAWFELATMVNELSRSMGQPDFYPFAISRPVVRKLQFVHLVVRDAAEP
jgi:hypothetical protein